MRKLLALSMCALLVGCTGVNLDGKASPQLVQTLHSPNVVLEYRVRLNELITVKKADALESSVAAAESKCRQMEAGVPICFPKEE